MNTNSLDLNNDISEIIGDYVKKDNLDGIVEFEFKIQAIVELMWGLKLKRWEKQ